MRILGWLMIVALFSALIYTGWPEVIGTLVVFGTIIFIFVATILITHY